ncbi:hypothetical protein BTUL_0068g00140 [Botrytis tulipae]|uniref:Uncharacterized protein n=1 Tax=Botrytis tulipae TaxID=87230 RepID=A0A4Z1EXF2_9HELO|nr:hypothetical protein BTUL_0068g00140 [Botrytis tulipae]
MHMLNVDKIISPIITIVSTLHVANFDPSPAMRKLHATNVSYSGQVEAWPGYGQDGTQHQQKEREDNLGDSLSCVNEMTLRWSSGGHCRGGSLGVYVAN